MYIMFKKVINNILRIIRFVAGFIFLLSLFGIIVLLWLSYSDIMIFVSKLCITSLVVFISILMYQ